MARACFHAGLWAAGLLAACGDAGPPPEPTYKIRGGLAHTLGLPMLIGTSTAPPAYVRARELYRTSTTAFSQGRVGDAAQGFLELGYGLRVAGDPAHAGAYLAARCIAYQNAGTAWLRAGQPLAAKAVLWAAEARDPECDHSIAQVYRRVDAALAATSSTSATRDSP
ncbi:MAG: hypothetical protein AAGD10_03070 [Myxococcota bacterium]